MKVTICDACQSSVDVKRFAVQSIAYDFCLECRTTIFTKLMDMGVPGERLPAWFARPDLVRGMGSTWGSP